MCKQICSLVVLLISVLIGLIVSGQLAHLGFFRYMNQYPTYAGFSRFSLTDEQKSVFVFSDIPDLTGTVSLVTGSNVGLGYFTALHLAKKGSTVIMACRNMKKCNDAAEKIRLNSTKNGKVVPMELDLSSLESVEKFSKQVNEKFDRLDYTVLNAGVGGHPEFTLSVDGIEATFASNHLGHFKLFLDLQTLIEETATKKGVATITHVSSNSNFEAVFPSGMFSTLEHVNNRTEFVPIPRYSVTKFFNILLSNAVSRKMKAKGVNVLSNSAHPGLVNTNIWELGVTEANKLPAWQAAPLLHLIELVRWYGWTAEEASLTQLYTTVSPRVINDKITGQYFHPIAFPVTPNPFATKENEEILWKLSVELLKSRGFNKDA